MRNFSYSVAIRTLGKAGDKYQQELDSLVGQTIKPSKIVVYLAEGYERPAQTVGIEEYVTVPKGMVAQRALDYKEIDTDYVLLLDDDVFLADDAVEKMLKTMIEQQADCVAADVLKNHDMSLARKIYSYATNMVYPRFGSKWAFKIGRNATFSYNNNPRTEAYPSQSAGGPISLWRKEALLGINFKAEKWLDTFSFAYGDDMLFFYKLYANLGKLLVDYSVEAIHLDAGTARKSYNKDKEKLTNRSQIQFILWWRTSYSRKDNNGTKRFCSAVSYGVRLIHSLLLHLLYSLITLSIRPLAAYFKGNISGYKYVKSEEYKKVPNFIIDKKL